MAIDFKYTISEYQYRDWIRQSNEELIPKPLTLLFQFPDHPPDEQYWRDLHAELSIQADLFDSDRKVIKLLVVGIELESLAPDYCRQLLDEIQTRYDLVCPPRFEQKNSLPCFCDTCDTIGHGLAAISQINEKLIQNTEDQRCYRRSIEAGMIPVTKAWNRRHDKSLQVGFRRPD